MFCFFPISSMRDGRDGYFILYTRNSQAHPLLQAMKEYGDSQNKVELLLMLAFNRGL